MNLQVSREEKYDADQVHKQQELESYIRLEIQVEPLYLFENLNELKGFEINLPKFPL